MIFFESHQPINTNLICSLYKTGCKRKQKGPGFSQATM